MKRYFNSFLGLAFAILVVLTFFSYGPKWSSEVENRPNHVENASSEGQSLRLPQTEASQIRQPSSLSGRGRDRSKSIATVAEESNPSLSGKSNLSTLGLRDIASKNSEVQTTNRELRKLESMPQYALLEGTRAVPSQKNLEGNYQKLSTLGPYVVVRAKGDEEKKQWAGVQATKRLPDSLPIIVSKRDQKLHAVTGNIDLTLKKYSESQIKSLLSDYPLKKVGSMESIQFLEVQVKEGADIFDVFSKVSQDPRVLRANLDFYKAGPSLK